MRTLAELEQDAREWQEMARMCHEDANDALGQELRRYASQWAIAMLDACNIMKGQSDDV